MIYQCSIEHTLHPVWFVACFKLVGRGFFLDVHNHAWLSGVKGRKRSPILVACPASPSSCLDREASATCHDSR